MKNYIEIKSDGRFKKGHIVKKGDQLRGNPESMKLERMEAPGLMNLNPPIIVSAELGKQIKRAIG